MLAILLPTFAPFFLVFVLYIWRNEKQGTLFLHVWYDILLKISFLLIFVAVIERNYAWMGIGISGLNELEDKDCIRLKLISDIDFFLLLF